MVCAIASFDRRALSAAKTLVNNVSLPSADRLLNALNSFQTALTWTETQRRIEALLKRGLQQDLRMLFDRIGAPTSQSPPPAGPI